MTAEKLFEHLGPLVAPALEQLFNRRDLCIVATAVAIDVAEYFGITARPLPVRTVAYNALFAERYDAGRTDFENWWAEGAHSVGIGFGAQARKWDGHLIVAAGGMFGDFSIRQAERLEKGIVTGWAVAGPLPEQDYWTLESGQGTRIEYQRIANSGYLRSPDWRDKARRRTIVGALIRRVRMEAA